MNAFADHFLEDLFSAGHLRTPRRHLHSSSWFVPAPDYCAKLMHDEDNAIGLSVQNPGGETWTAYGDKRALDLENDDNKKRCIQAIQASADEIYRAWKNKTKPSKSRYGAWAHSPTLESARGQQTLAPLFKDKQRRATIKNRRDWSFTRSWAFPDTALKCMNSGWWNYPITIDLPPRVLDGSDVATIATGTNMGKIYYQDTQGVIREHTLDGGWSATTSPTFSAKMFSPLASTTFDSGKEIRVYSISEDGYLQEWCQSSGQIGWQPGYLSNSKFRVAVNTRLAVVSWGSNVRLYAQGPNSDNIQEYVSGNPWTKGTMLPVASTGTGLSAVCWPAGGTNVCIRVYCQAPDMTLKEHCWDVNRWYVGNFRTEKMPRNTSIAAVRWCSWGPQLRVYCQDARKRIITYKFEGNWSSDSTVIGPLMLGRLSSVLQWNDGNELRVYYQADDGKIRERCQSNDMAWFGGQFVSI